MSTSSDRSDVKSQQIRDLPRASAAAWNSYTNAARPTCFEGTRTTVLSQIYSWMGSTDENEPQIYTLDGLAGIGKSTVARTVAEQAHKLGWLGASFFFSRSDYERKSAKLFFGTVAFQLAVHVPELSRSISEVLKQNPDAAGTQLQDQLRDLVIEPLIRHSLTSTSTILIVIDALDECDNYDAKQLLLHFLLQVRNARRLRILFTTRSELHIINTLHLHDGHHLYRLHDIEDSIVENDIRSYLVSGLSQREVGLAFPEMEPPPWTPSHSDLNTLIMAAGKLFIIASTVIKYILDDKICDPQSQTDDLVRGIAVDDTGDNPMNMLDSIYTQILRAAFPSKSPRLAERFQAVIGTILLLQEPLALSSLASLLQPDGVDVPSALLHIQSIISLDGKEKVPRIYHKSFPDFVTDATRCSKDPRFHIEVGKHHARITLRCFQIMNKQLRTNICGLEFPSNFLDNDQVRHLTDEKISLELRYACMHWATHLRNADLYDQIPIMMLLESFSFTHLLHWLEVLSLIGQLQAAYAVLDQARIFAVGFFNKHGGPHAEYRTARKQPNSRHLCHVG